MYKENYFSTYEFERRRMSAIELNKVNFGYVKNNLILENLSMHIPKGSIYGFLGPNGAGKTTTLKLILRLLKANSGDINILEQNISNTYPKYLSHLGSLIENSSLYEHLSAKDNLRIWGKHYKSSNNQIAEILETVGLQDAHKKKVANFSTGMKQRLGLGIALLNDPEILILDEPTNGLDPMGITSLRNILFNLRDQGKTILLSSHILSEVEKVVSHVGILKQGSLAFEGAISELEELMTTNIELTLRVDKPQLATDKLKDQYKISQNESILSFKILHQDEVNDIIKLCMQNDIRIFEIYNQKSDLENLFMNISKTEN